MDFRVANIMIIQAKHDFVVCLMVGSIIGDPQTNTQVSTNSTAKPLISTLALSFSMHFISKGLLSIISM